MSSLKDLLDQKQALEAQIAAAQAAEKAAGIAKVKQLMAEHGLTPTDIVRVDRKVRTSKPVPPKYGDAAGNRWSGRGLQPAWVKAALAAGQTLETLTLAK